MKKRKIQDITCQICNNVYKSIGMATHLKDTHNTTINEYVSKYGEFRKNFLKKKPLTDKIYNCQICNEEFDTKQKLGMHIKFKHNMTKKQYYVKFMYNGVIPKCKCGCGEDVSFIPTYPYFREYITGHNKSTLGYKFSEESKIKMSKSALRKFDLWRKIGKTADMHLRKNILKSHYKNKKYYLDLLKENNIKCLSDIENDNKLKFKCEMCGHTWIQNNLRAVCDICNEKAERSKGESELKYFLEENNITFISNDRKILNGYELDILIPDKKLAIEYNGLYWHSEISGNKYKKYHVDKTSKCEKENIKLIHIFEDEWINKKEIIKKRILHELNMSHSIRIYARNCEIREINTDIKDDFLIKNHLQGKDNSSIRLGAFYNGKLISIMTFGKSRIALGQSKNKENVYEMYRYCSDMEYNVIGIAGKLLKYFIKNYYVKEIITYADKRWTSEFDTSLYDILGFNQISITPPNYFYTKYQARLHRFNFRKNVLNEKLEKFDDNLTEWENMQLNGFDRIWDCGHIKYKMEL